jgi:hypothetical protein
MEDIQKNTIECKYGSKCHNPNCRFFHGDEPTMINMVYDFPIINKKVKNVKKVKKLFNEYINENNIIDDTIRCINEKGIEPTNITIIKKDKNIRNDISIKTNDKENNELLSYIDTYYNNIINRKNKYISEITERNYNCINILRNDNKKLKDIIENLKKSHTINKMVENKPKNINENKLINIYNKYVDLHNIFKVSNYKHVNINEIKKYTKDKNIYKVKQRAEKIYNFYSKFKKGIFKEYLPISKIITMKF